MGKNRSAFTLAEVLITIGIIGIVAAMTIPNLITKFEKHRTETQLLKFYSMINQTVRLSSEENGDPETWITVNHTNTYAENYKVIQEFIAPYMKNLGYYRCEASKNVVCVILPDGGLMAFRIDANGGDIGYYVKANYYGNTSKLRSHVKFSFQFAKVSGLNNGVTNSKNYVEPYSFTWKGTREDLLNNANYGCNRNASSPYVLCTKLIQLNSWKIPDDYPW
jgi:prepilin-type N-terminal cleavage/methylation domain-containing protein